MQVIRDVGACGDRLADVPGTVVTIGAYDGVHRGHRALIGVVTDRARELGVSSAMVTFDRHPATVVRPESAPKLLTDTEQKLELLADTGLEWVVVVHFDEHRASESAEDFVNEVLVGCLRARSVVVGEDFHFGRGRRGNVALLRSLGADLGFDVMGVGLVTVPGLDEPVSSTAIRTALSRGEVETAARLLGRPYEVRGTVETGDRRGRELGFPTANVAVPAEILVPADGIYAGWYTRPDGETKSAAISVGRRPTFYDSGPRLVEAYLLDFDDDLYGEEARVRFVAKLHDEEKFDSAEALVEQMHKDVEATRAALNS
jgi:riboflavin kinase/FMN adenylyltransferase